MKNIRKALFVGAILASLSLFGCSKKTSKDNTTKQTKTEETTTTKAPVKVAMVDFDSNGGSTVNSQMAIVGQLIPKPADPERKGHTFIGWYNGENLWDFDKNKLEAEGIFTLKAKWTVNSYTLTLSKNIEEAGTIQGGGTIEYDSYATVSAKTNEGYTFNGWFEGDELAIWPANLTFLMPARDLNYTARWTLNKYTITLDNETEGVTITGVNSGSEYDYKSEITLTASNIPSGYTLIWSRSDGVIEFGDTYTFNVPLYDVTITATARPFIKEGNKIYFGTYPQTEVEATAENGLISIEFDDSWTSYNYYISSTISDYMFYKDVDTNGDGRFDYRGVYFTQYRPAWISDPSTEDNSYQDNNGYTTNTIYWFSYDPIEWDILTISSGKALLLANLILDSQDYYSSNSNTSFSHNGGTGYCNNYELSNIRQFLNDNFYKTAFNDLQKAIIETIEVDNSASSTEEKASKYACNNTLDKMFLLSYSDLTNSSYGLDSQLARQTKGTDYAKAQGLQAYASYYGNSCWWLRSPHDTVSGAYCIYWDGVFEGNIIFITQRGVRPALWIEL